MDSAKGFAHSALVQLDNFRASISVQLKSADLSIFHEFAPPPGGGGHQFLRAFWRETEAHGLRVENNLISHTTRACLLNSFNYDASRLRRLRRKAVTYVHRVDGPISAYRGREEGIDLDIWRANQELADRTIFQSRYSLEKHLEMGLQFRDPVIIPNAADPMTFHRRGRLSFSRERKIRLLASSWSDNLNKGATVYQWLDEHLDWDRFEFTFVGRTPVEYRNIKVLPPVDSHKMAELFRSHDIYITASKNDPCSNSLIEALSCGLPALYLNSGGHPELVGNAGFAFESAEDVLMLLDKLVAEYEIRQSNISSPSIQDVTLKYLATLGLT